MGRRVCNCFNRSFSFCLLPLYLFYLVKFIYSFKTLVQHVFSTRIEESLLFAKLQDFSHHLLLFFLQIALFAFKLFLFNSGRTTHITLSICANTFITLFQIIRNNVFQLLLFITAIGRHLYTSSSYSLSQSESFLKFSMFRRHSQQRNLLGHEEWAQPYLSSQHVSQLAKALRTRPLKGDLVLRLSSQLQIAMSHRLRIT